MSLSIGIVGLPNVGKSTLFNALTEKAVPAENYPFCTIDPSVGVVPVPDRRLESLADFSKSESVVPVVVEFVDIAGLVRGASKGEGLGNEFLQNIRDVDVIAHVVRIFDDDSLIHVEGSVYPARDIETINTELLLSDIDTVQRRIAKTERDVKKGDKDAVAESESLKKAINLLSEGLRLYGSNLTDDERKRLKPLNLLTLKPMLYVLNKKAGAINLDEVRDGRIEDLEMQLDRENAPQVKIDAGIGSELQGIDPAEKESFRLELGAQDDGVDSLIKKGYEMLDLITYFTTGEKETRGWTIRRGSSAPEAGSAIHSDFQEKFIKAEVVEWQKLLEAGSKSEARDKGLIRTEGKEYIVKDGDVIEFKI